MIIYKTKPVQILAAQWKGGDPKDFCFKNNMPIFNIGEIDGVVGLIIPTLEGDHPAMEGDYIILGLGGEYYPCKPDIFKMKYYQAGNDSNSTENADRL